MASQQKGWVLNDAVPAGQVGGEPATLAGELEKLPASKAYESADEDDGPTGDVLEGAELLGVADHCPRQDPDTQQAAASSPTERHRSNSRCTWGQPRASSVAPQLHLPRLRPPRLQPPCA